MIGQDEVAALQEIVGPLWVSTEAIPYDAMWADDALWLPELLQGRRFAGRFVFEGDTMLSHELVNVA